MRIEDDFPQVPIRILEITGITAVKSIPSVFDDMRSSVFRPFHHLVDLFSASHIMADGEVRGRRIGQGQACIVGNTFTRPDCQLQSVVKIENATAPNSNSVPTIPAEGRPNPSW